MKYGYNQVFSAIYLKKLFNKNLCVNIHDPSQVLIHPLVFFQWKVNVMGIKNASKLFKAMIEDLLEPVKDVADPFVNYIVIKYNVEPNTLDLIDKHYQDIRRVLQILKAEKLFGGFAKMQVFL